ncbi:MAG: site-2 protease family protein [Candidatus Omnitrophica bacterium]|nr:site-2 protease family protein [Candidatus Omnitrophota bacterium]
MRFVITLSIFFLAVMIHEYAHGWIAWKLGDATAKSQGRLTLNPIAHIDPVGTVLLPLLLFITHLVTRAPLILFGWAKPVPVNFRNMRNPKRDMIWVGLAGPTANVLFAVLISFILKSPIVMMSPFFTAILNVAIILNLVLAVFNILPIPPLDGSRVLMGILPRKLSMEYAKLEPYGFIIILGLVYLGLLGTVIWPLVIFLSNLLGASL